MWGRLFSSINGRLYLLDEKPGACFVSRRFPSRSRRTKKCLKCTRLTFAAAQRFKMFKRSFWETFTETACWRSPFDFKSSIKWLFYLLFAAAFSVGSVFQQFAICLESRNAALKTKGIELRRIVQLFTMYLTRDTFPWSNSTISDREDSCFQDFFFSFHSFLLP